MAVKTVANGGGNWNSAATWSPSGVPSATADNVVFSTQSGPLTISATATIEAIDFTNYRNTLTLDWPLNVTGNMNLGTGGYTVSFYPFPILPFPEVPNVFSIPRGRVIYSDTGTITNNGAFWRSPWQFTGSADTVTLVNDFNLDGDLYFNPTTSLTINGRGTASLNIYRGLYHTNTAFVTGSASINILGFGTWSHQTTGDIRNNVNLNPSGTFTLAGGIHYNQRTLKYIGGNVRNFAPDGGWFSAPTFSNIYIDRSTTLDTGTLSFLYVTVEQTPRIDLVSNLYITGTLSVDRSASILGTGSLMFTDTNNEVTGSIYMNPTAAAMTFTFSKNTTVKSAILGGNYNLTLNQNTLTIEKDLVILTSLINLSNTNNRVQGTTNFLMTGSGSLVSESLFGRYRNTCRNTIEINTPGTIAFAMTHSNFWRGSYWNGGLYYDLFLYGNATMSLISGNILTATGSLILEDTSANISGFQNVTFPTLAFSDWARFTKPYTRTLPHDIKAINIKFGLYQFESNSNQSSRDYPTYNINGGFTMYAKNLFIIGTVSGNSKIHLYDNGFIRTTDLEWYDPDADTFNMVSGSMIAPCQLSEVTISPTFGATSALIQLAPTGFHVINSRVNIGANAGFTSSWISSTITQLSETLWMSGSCTFSGNSPEYPIRIAYGGIGSNLTTHKLDLLNQTYVREYFALHFWKFHNTGARNRSLTIENTQNLRLENATLQLLSGHLTIDHGLTTSYIIMGVTAANFYSLGSGYYVGDSTNGASSSYLTASSYIINLTGGIMNFGYDSTNELVCHDGTFSLIGTGTLYSPNFGRVVSDIVINTSGVLTYRKFVWGSLLNNRFRTFKYISGQFSNFNSNSLLHFSHLGGYIDLTGLTVSRVKFGETWTTEYVRAIRNTSWVLQSDINVTDKLIFEGTSSFTMSSYVFNNSGDLEFHNDGDYNLFGNMYCRNLVITDRDTSTDFYSPMLVRQRLTKFYNGNIYVSGSFSTRMYMINYQPNTCMIGTTGGSRSKIYMIGTGSIYNFYGSGEYYGGGGIELDLIIDTPGTITLTGSAIYLDGGTFSYESGNVIMGNRTVLSVIGDSTLDTFGMTFSRIYFIPEIGGNSAPSGGYNNVRLLSQLDTYGTVSLYTSTFSFIGTRGFNISGFSFPKTWAYNGSFWDRTAEQSPVNIRFLPSATYSFRNSFNFVNTSSRQKPHYLHSLGPRANLVISHEATQDLPFVNADLINSSAGATVWTYKGTFSNTLNWNLLPTQPKTISSSSQS